MDTYNIVMLANVCVVFGSLGLLNMEDEELICMYLECLAIYLHFRDIWRFIYLLRQKIPNLFRDLPCPKAIHFYEKYLKLIEHYGKRSIVDGMIVRAVKGDLNLDLAKSHFKSGNFHLAMNYGKTALGIARNRTVLKDIEAWSYSIIGHAYRELGEYKKAIEYYKKCLDMNYRDKKLEMQVYTGLGMTQCCLDNHEEAKEYFKKGLALALDLRDKDAIAICYGRLGRSYKATSEWDQAMDYFQTELDIALEIVDKLLQLEAYVGIADIYMARYQYDEAFEYLEKRVKIAKQIGNKNNEAVGYFNLGVCCHRMYNYRKAIEFYQKALEIYQQTGYKEGEERVYEHLAQASIELGRYDDAINNVHKGLDIATQNDNKLERCRMLRYKGDIYQRSGRRDEAISIYLECFNFAVKTSNKELQIDVLDSLAMAYHGIGNIPKAKEYLEMKIKLSIEIGHRNGEGQGYTNLANILYLEEGKYIEAISYLLKSLDIAIHIHDKHLTSYSYILLGYCNGSLHNHSEAICCFEDALAIAQQSKFKFLEAASNAGLGITYYRLAYYGLLISPAQSSHYKKSEMYLREAIKGHEFSFHHLRDRDDFKIPFLKEYRHLYDVLTVVLTETQQMEEALLVREREKARSLNDLLVSKYFVPPQDIETPSTSLKYVEVEEFLQASRMCILFYSIQPLVFKWIIWVLVHNRPISYHDKGIWLDRNALSLMKIYHGPQVHNHPISHLDKISRLKTFTDLQTLIYEAYESIDVTVVRAMNCEDRSKDVDKSQSHGDEGQAAEKCSSKQDTEKSSNQEKSESPDKPSTETTNDQESLKRHPLEKLFDLLIAPVQSSLTEEGIVIIPDGPLYTVPFAALRDSKTGQFLFEIKRIRLAPSITALKTWKECPADYHSTESALVIGNPKMGQIMFRGEVGTPGPLPSAEEEAKLIGGCLENEIVSEGLEVTVLTGSQATKEEFKKRVAKGVAVIHIAAHGDSQTGDIFLAPSQAAIQKGTPKEEDYLLTMREVQQIGIRAKLVVLSCCHSGRGDIEPEGLIGMSRAFLAAGARAVIASLWAVDDLVTMSFMSQLYYFLKGGHSASASLQKAMEQIRKEDSHPKYWAPFYLIGDDVTIFKSDLNE